MFKENRNYFLYLLGILVLFIVMVFILRYLLAGGGSSNCGFLGLSCIFGKKEMIYEKAPEFTIDTSKDYQALIKTNKGDIYIDLYEKNAPNTVNNFVFLASEGYYENVKFHRVKKGLLLQTGDRNTLDNDEENDGEGSCGYTFSDEINWDSLNLSEAKRQQLENLGYSNDSDTTSISLDQWKIAMANRGPDTNGSQFFFVTAPSGDTTIQSLNGRHTVFAEVYKGYEVLLEIENVEVVDLDSSSPRPVEDIIIKEVQIITK